MFRTKSSSPRKFGLIVGALMLASTAGHADSQTTWFGEVADGQWMAGLKLGVAEPGINGYRAAQTAAVVLGYQFSRPVGDGGTSSIELELGTSNDADINIGGNTGDWDIHTTGLFFNYRSPGTVYFKGKLGLLDTNIISKFPLGSVESDDATFALGFGGGVRMGTPENRINVEAEWVTTNNDHDINFFNIGGLVEF